MRGEFLKGITLTKLDVARRQVETAINLWAADGEPVAIHTLTAAGHRVLMDLSKHRGLGTPALFDVSQIRPGMEREYKKFVRRAETFFKHANDDPEATLKFDPDFTEPYLWDACETYKKLTGRASLLMAAFSSLYMVSNPMFLRSYSPEMAEQFAKINLAVLSRKNQLDIFAQVITLREGK